MYTVAVFSVMLVLSIDMVLSPKWKLQKLSRPLNLMSGTAYLTLNFYKINFEILTLEGIEICPHFL